MNEIELDNTTEPRSVGQQQACSPRPRPENFGYEEMDGYGEHGAGGWQFEGGEEAYDAAMALWEKANAKSEAQSPEKRS